MQVMEDLHHYWVGDHSVLISKRPMLDPKIYQNEGWGASIKRAWHSNGGYPFEYEIWFYLLGRQFLISFTDF